MTSRELPLTLQPSAADEQAIDALASAWGLSRHDAVLRAVREAAQQQAPVDLMATSERGLAAYSGLLERLGEA